MATKEPKQETLKLENSYILSAELGNKVISTFQNMPILYYEMLAPILQELSKCPRVNGEISVNFPEE